MPTHGSLTKAGKVRNQTPKVAKMESKQKSFGPRRRNQRNYQKMIADERNFSGRGRRRRRRRRR